MPAARAVVAVVAVAVVEMLEDWQRFAVSERVGRRLLKWLLQWELLLSALLLVSKSTWRLYEPGSEYIVSRSQS